MKWYKKQIDKLKTANPEKFMIDEEEVSKNPKHDFEERKKVVNKPVFKNPVTLRNINRPKTDA